MEYFLFGLSDWRDVMIIAVGALTAIVLVAILFVTVLLGLAVRGLLGVVRRLLNDEVSPLIGSARQTVDQVRGTVTFVSETAVRPIIRVYGVVSGARKAMGIIAGITSHRDDR